MFRYLSMIQSYIGDCVGTHLEDYVGTCVGNIDGYSDSQDYPGLSILDPPEVLVSSVGVLPVGVSPGDISPPLIVMKEDNGQKKEDLSGVEIRICLIDSVITQIQTKNIMDTGFKVYDLDNESLNKSPHDPHIMRLVDSWFSIDSTNRVIVKDILFQKLEDRYKNHRRKNKSAEWFKKTPGWIKFSCKGREVIPTAFDKIKIDK